MGPGIFTSAPLCGGERQTTIEASHHGAVREASSIMGSRRSAGAASPRVLLFAANRLMPLGPEMSSFAASSLIYLRDAQLPKLSVEGLIPFARSNDFKCLGR